ncbi:uncharacterized protein LOC123704829 [Colias croceus]|uniref:uncharacterized protein LOC123704829 n=1 Tax=Colias crocea TaxID=72248 RepID=UPI001E27A24C|nr:uncharacterized protein LOC123704829 [Colias croceus]
MSGFKALRDISKQFENELKLHSSNIFCAKVDESFENVIAKKVRDISLITSKLRLLQAKTLAATPQIKETNKDEITTAINDYTDTVTWKLIEQQIVKTLTQTHSVKTLVTAPDRSLDPELLERKEKIIAQIMEYSQKEKILLNLDEILKEREIKLLEARREWQGVFGNLKDSQNVLLEERATGPLYKKLQTLVDKMEIMRWVISKLVTSSTSDYDWATDPHRRLKALALTRQCHTVHSFTDV